MKNVLVALSIFAVLVGGYFGLNAYKKYQTRTNIEALLKDAKQKADQAVITRAQEFEKFIESKKPGAKQFSVDVIGLKGMWTTIKCVVPWAADDCYKKYISEKFSEHIFTPEEFRDAMNDAIKGGVQDIDGIENQLAVSLRQVILGRSLTTEELPGAEAEFKILIETARGASNDAVIKEMGGLVATEVITQITTQVLVRLGVPLVILTTAGTNAWWTLGGSLVLGVLVNTIWNYFNHPAEGVEKAVILELGRISTDGSAAIRDELTKKVAARNQLWEITMQEALQ